MREGLTNAGVRDMPGGTRVGKWRRDFTTRAQLSRIVCGHEMKVFCAGKRASSVSWEMRPIAGGWVNESGEAGSFDLAMSLAEKALRKLLADGIDEVDRA